MNSINLLYRAGESKKNYQKRIVCRLAKNELIEKLVVISRSDDIPKNNKKIIEYQSEIGWSYKFYQMQEYLESMPLNRKILEGLRAYEATALLIAGRDTNFDIYSVQEAHKLFYDSIRFWNHIIDKFHINYMVFGYVPHVLHEYAIYCLAKVKKIPMTVFSGTHIPGVYVWGKDISSIGNNIGEIYIQGDLSTELSNKKLIGYLNKNYYKNTSVQILNKPNMIKNSKIELYRFIDKRTVFKRFGSFFKSILLQKPVDIQYIKKNIHDTFRAYSVFQRQKKLKYYNTIASFPNYKEKYIFFALQLQPESTTLPGAGVFADQLFSIRILAKAAKINGVKVYVKEHFVQLSRDRIFYDDLRKIDNIYLIKMDIPTEELIDHALAVSTQTGSCSLEAVLKKKNAFVFGDNYYWKNIPGIYKIDNVSQCDRLIKQILDGTINEIKEEEILKYFHAIEKKSIEIFSYVSEIKGRDFYYEESIYNFVSLILQILQNSFIKD